MNNLNYIDISSLFSNQSIRALFSLKTFAVTGQINANTFAKEVGFDPTTLTIPQQIHSSNVSVCSLPGKISECDGTFTNQSDLVCSIQVADCLPIFFAHRFELIFGLVHAGWRGLVNNIILESGLLLKKCNYDLSEFEVIIGPSIQKCCFEVGPDIVDNFNSRYVKNINSNKVKVDLQKLAFDKFLEIDFKKNNIYQMDDCTLCNSEKYYSYRKDGVKAGRMIGLIGAK